MPLYLPYYGYARYAEGTALYRKKTVACTAVRFARVRIGVPRVCNDRMYFVGVIRFSSLRFFKSNRPN